MYGPRGLPAIYITGKVPAESFLWRYMHGEWLRRRWFIAAWDGSSMVKGISLCELLMILACHIYDFVSYMCRTRKSHAKSIGNPRTKSQPRKLTTDCGLESSRVASRVEKMTSDRDTRRWWEQSRNQIQCETVDKLQMSPALLLMRWEYPVTSGGGRPLHVCSRPKFSGIEKSRLSRLAIFPASSAAGFRF